MEKKRYYRIDNGDMPIIDASLQVIMDILQSEASTYVNEHVTEQDTPEWTIDLIWLSDEEFEKLDEA